MFSGGACSAFGVNSEYTTEGTEKGKERSYTKRRTEVQNEFNILNVTRTEKGKDRSYNRKRTEVQNRFDIL